MFSVKHLKIRYLKNDCQLKHICSIIASPTLILQVLEYQEYGDGDIQHSKTYKFHHLKGNIVSMRVSSVAVLQGTTQPCNIKMCENQICIPNDIEPQCRCGDDDTQCQKENEQKVSRLSVKRACHLAVSC